MTFKTTKIKLRNTKYRSRSLDELKEIAKGIVNKEIFTSNHLNDDERKNLGTVFPVLAMMSPIQTREMWQQKPWLFYASYGGRRDQFPTGVNGLPMMTSVTWLDKTDTLKVETLIRKYEDAIKAIDTARV